MTDSSLSGDALYADVRRYESFGVHRYGSPGADTTLLWIARELERAGLAVAAQKFTTPRQYDFVSGRLEADGVRLDVMPQWWPPTDRASFHLRAPIGPGGFERLSLSFDRGAYLNDAHRKAIGQAFARDAAAVLLSIDHPSGEIFAYNVDQTSDPWPVPVILVAPKDRSALDRARQSGASVSVAIEGRYRSDVEGCNVVARHDRGIGRWIVVSTPVTGWFTSTCERGPGIAGFLAMARLAASRLTNVDLVFVATAGHEIGHGGMEHFLRHGAPRPQETLAWVHFGAAIACRDTTVRLLCRSASMAALTDRHFSAIEATRLTDEQAAVGELRDVRAAGYANFFGMAGLHRWFHTPADSSADTGPELLAPVVAAFAEALAEIAR